MRRWLRLLPLLAAAACSNLTEGENGVVALEIRIPEVQVVEVGEQLQLSARPLNADGDSVAANVAWRSRSSTLTVDNTGLLTGVSVGTGQVQAITGSLASELISFTVIAPADTLALVGDSVIVVPAGTTTTPNLVVRLESFSPAGPVTQRPVIYEITQPPAAAIPVVTLPGGVQIDTVSTTADGTVSGMTITLGSGQTPPDATIVEVRAQRTRGAPVPGSGQRFIILFE